MQSKQNNVIDTRTFQQIWEGMTQQEREDLTLDLYKSKACRTRQTIWNWANGIAQPSHPVVRDTVAAVVGKAIGSRVCGYSLFPR